jgi:(E)-4-hydroxy-3-methylbut-2-enyl-diphosphate synthase
VNIFSLPCGRSAVLPRRPTRAVRVGTATVGGGAPVTVQSMTNTPTADAERTLEQVRGLIAAGCEIVRVSVPDSDALDGFRELRRRLATPLVADVHFDHRLAVGALEAGADCVRINPGNIGGKEKVAQVVKAAAGAGASIRIGVNSGSLEKDILRRHGHPGAEALAESALRNAQMVQEMGFHAFKLSVKASAPLQTIRACRLLSEMTDHPLHLGVTEAGTAITGTARSALALGALLAEGIGDTIRISLAGDPLPEVTAGFAILRALGLRTGVRVVACPTCARAQVDVAALAGEVERRTRNITADLTVAVMGCPVNGPGEAREADVGIAGASESAVLFVRGEIRARLAPDEILDALMKEIETLTRQE